MKEKIKARELESKESWVTEAAVTQGSRKGWAAHEVKRREDEGGKEREWENGRMREMKVCASQRVNKQCQSPRVGSRSYMHG